MGFHWVSALGTIMPTIGTIVGKFLGAADDEAALLYQFSGEEDTSCKASFIKRNGQILLWNRSEDENALVTLSLPCIGSLKPQTITLQRNQTIVLDSLFKNCAAHDSTRLMLTASNNTAALKEGLTDAKEHFHICAAASDIPTDGNTPVRLGTYLTAVCSRDNAIFTSVNHPIIRISFADFQGRNDERVKIMDIPSIEQGTTTVVQVNFPSTFPEETELDIDVEVEMGGLSNILREQQELYAIQKLTAEEASLLKSIPILRP